MFVGVESSVREIVLSPGLARESMVDGDIAAKTA
jgi:hypothetical protein